MKKTLIAFFLTVYAATALYGAGSVVRIEGGEGSWHLTLNGKPYFINGGGGYAIQRVYRYSNGKADISSDWYKSHH